MCARVTCTSKLVVTRRSEGGALDVVFEVSFGPRMSGSTGVNLALPELWDWLQEELPCGHIPPVDRPSRISKLKPLCWSPEIQIHILRECPKKKKTNKPLDQMNPVALFTS